MYIEGFIIPKQTFVKAKQELRKVSKKSLA